VAPQGDVTAANVAGIDRDNVRTAGGIRLVAIVRLDLNKGHVPLFTVSAEVVETGVLHGISKSGTAVPLSLGVFNETVYTVSFVFSLNVGCGGSGSIGCIISRTALGVVVCRDVVQVLRVAIPLNNIHLGSTPS
jgi:hypothetical protein